MFCKQQINALAALIENTQLRDSRIPNKVFLIDDSNVTNFLSILAYRRATEGFKNIARGTTDPEIDSETWTKLGSNMAPLALIANLATR